MQRRENNQSGRVEACRFLVIVLLLLVPLAATFGQDDYYAEDDTSYFWDEGEYDDTGDEYYEDDYYEYDDTTYYDDGYYEDEYYEDEYYEDEYYEDEYYEDEYYEDDYYEDEYYEDEYYEDDSLAVDEGYYEYDDTQSEYVENRGAGELSGTELAERAERMGYSLGIAYSSPGFVNHSLNTYNSYADYRVGIEFPMLMQFLGARFRLGLEFGTFAFENYMPSGGEFKGNTIFGLLSFPAGPGQVKLGGGKIGDYYGYFAETSYGFAMGNILDIRVGVRATSALEVIDSNKNDVGTASWLDGLFLLGINF